MMKVALKVLGRGVFSVREASRLTGIPTRRLRRWLLGYEFRSRSGKHRSPPPVHRDFPLVDRELSLSFADLIEVRFVDHFLQAGVSWTTLRVVARRAADRIGSDHPFSSWRFKTDGKTILTEIAVGSKEPELLDLMSDQVAFKRILDPYLYRGLDFGPTHNVARWWHEAGHRKIVIDPERSLGRPILAESGVPTQVIAAAFRVEQSVAAVAEQFELP